MDQKGFPPEFIDLMEATDPVQPTSQVVHHAAAGMTLLLWRKPPLGPMPIRGRLGRRRHAPHEHPRHSDALGSPDRTVQDSENGEETLLDALRDICDLLPAEAMRDSLWDESHRKAAFWGSAISEFSPNRVLSIFTQLHPGRS